MSLKQSIKRAAQQAFAAVGPHRWPGGSPRLVVLTYHRILPRSDPRYDEEQPGMVVEPDTLRMHLRVAKQYFEPMALQDWLDRAAAGKPPPSKAFAVTFDDGWRDNFDYGFATLQDVQVPATVFLVSDMVGTGQTFWPERLSKTVLWVHGQGSSGAWSLPEFHWLTELGVRYRGDGGRPSRDELDEIVTQSKRFSDSELHRRIDAMQAVVGMDKSAAEPDIVDWEQLAVMRDSGLVTYGSHTRRHVRMIPGLDRATMEDEIVASKALLEARVGRPVELFCYPNGDIQPQAEALVRQHYRGALTTSTGWHRLGEDPFRIKRIGVHQDIAYDETSFLSRLSGWL